MSTDKQLAVLKTGSEQEGGSLTAGTTTVSIQTRQWRAEPDGPNDIPADIWYNGKWVPAWFSDIKAGDFYLLMDANLEPDRCFYAASDVRRNIQRNGQPQHVIRNGSQIVQAPAIKDINTIAHERKLLK